MPVRQIVFAAQYCHRILNVFMYCFVYSLHQLAPEDGGVTGARLIFKSRHILLNTLTRILLLFIKQIFNGNRTSQQHIFMRIVLIKMILIDVVKLC